MLLILGDSLSAGYEMDRQQSWPALLEKKLAATGNPCKVLNSSISGDTTQGGLSRLPRLLDRYQPVLVIIELGANDGLRGISPTVSRNNLLRMIELSQARGARVMLTGIKLPPNYGPEYLREFESMYGDLAEEKQTLLVPFFMRGVALKPELLLADGIHPNAEAQPVLLDNVWRILRPVLAEGLCR